MAGTLLSHFFQIRVASLYIMVLGVILVGTLVVALHVFRNGVILLLNAVAKKAILCTYESSKKSIGILDVRHILLNGILYMLFLQDGFFLTFFFEILFPHTLNFAAGFSMSLFSRSSRSRRRWSCRRGRRTRRLSCGRRAA